MNRESMGRALIFLAATMLVACGGGGGGGSNAAELKSEADIAREIANINAYLSGSGSVGAKRGSGGAAKPARPGARSMDLKQAYVAKGIARSKPTSPKAAEQVPCDSGFYTYEFFEGQTRNLPLFSSSRTMDYEVEDNHDCVDTGEGASLSYDGHIEYGSNFAYAEWTPSDPVFDYSIDGTGKTPFVFEYSDADGEFQVSALGRSESRDDRSLWEYREALESDFNVTYLGDSLSGRVRTGTAGNPLTTTYDFADGSFTVDGPFTYSSDFCEGGTVRFTTVEPVTFGSDESGEFPNGGTVTIASGNASVTVTFQLDGGATYEFSNGTSGAMTREELESATPCVVSL